MGVDLQLPGAPGLEPPHHQLLGAPHPAGEDLSLIRWMLKMTPTERLEFAQRFAAGVQVLRNARRIR